MEKKGKKGEIGHIQFVGSSKVKERERGGTKRSINVLTSHIARSKLMSFRVPAGLQDPLLSGRENQ